MVVQKIRQLVHLQVITELETVEICKEYYQYSRKCTNTSDTKHTIVFIDRIWQIIVRLKVNLKSLANACWFVDFALSLVKTCWY